MKKKFVGLAANLHDHTVSRTIALPLKELEEMIATVLESKYGIRKGEIKTYLSFTYEYENRTPCQMIAEEKDGIKELPQEVADADLIQLLLDEVLDGDYDRVYTLNGTYVYVETQFYDE